MHDDLLAVLRVCLDASHATFAEPPTPLTGGFSNEILRFRLDGAPERASGPLVIRLGHDDDGMARECAIQQHVSAHGVAAPAVLAYGSSSHGLGRPFAVSPLLSGVAFDDLISARTALATFRRVSSQLAATMCAVHEVDTAGLVIPAAGALDEIDELLGQLADPFLREAGRWLRDHTPETGADVICHGDLHPFNLLFDGPAVVAVLDWELARLDDAAYDVARTALLLRAAPYPMPPLVRRIVQPIGGRLADAFIREYRARRSLDDRSFEWHDALHCTRTLVMANFGAAHPEVERLARLAEVWLPVAPFLRRRLARIAK